MKIIIIRHGDPDYEHDSLTSVGENEAQALAEFLKNIKAEILPWLKEFDGKMNIENNKSHIFWDVLPQTLSENKFLYNPQTWRDSSFFNEKELRKYDEVYSSFDSLLEKFGYEREKNYYKVLDSNRKTLVFVCHFGLESMILSHLFNTSPFSLSQHFIAAPTSMTTLYTEERRKGVAQFRCSEYGSVAHLYIKHKKPSFSGRFCETYDSKERHD